ncbi:MAG: ComEC family DNA internalization-related competence protein, partial [SAR202 cluster bacterium]|nr:ComEC family DNA internalization-related competence protein [SAR202 cluster bacterium]
QGFSIAGIPATLLVVPFVPFVIAASAVAGVIGLASAAIAVPLGWVSWLPTVYVTTIAEVMSGIPGTFRETGQLHVLWVALYYGALLAVVLSRPVRRWAERRRNEIETRATPSRLQLRIVVPTIALAILAALLWVAAASVPDGKLHVVFLDVGQGDAILIETPNGRRVLIDGGPDPLGAVRFLGRRDRFFDRDIELVVLTQPHADHVTGLIEVLKRYRVDAVLEPQTLYDSPPYAAWKRALSAEGARITRAASGQIFMLDEGVVLEVLAPPDDRFAGTRSDVDNASVVTRLTYGDVSFLLTADIFKETEYWLLRAGTQIQADVLKVAHHGSRSSSLTDFLDAVAPSLAIISSGKDNRFGHPHPETLEALHRSIPAGRVFTTAERGAIEIVTDGSTARITTER